MIDKLCDPQLPSKQRLILKPQKRERINLKRQPQDYHQSINKNNDTTSHSHIDIVGNNNNINGFFPEYKTLPIRIKLNSQLNGVHNTNSTAQNDPTPSNDTSPPAKPIVHYPKGPAKKLSKEELNPPTPSIFVQAEEEIFSPQLQEFCLAHPIVVIRNISRILKLNLGLFSTKTLVNHDSGHLIEVRTQLEQPSDQNWDMERKNKIWRCESPRRFSKIGKYAHYQAKTFQDHLTKTDGDSTEEEFPVNDNCTSNRKNSFFKMVTFGTNVDLSDNRKWKLQLDELDKLPMFARVASASNMLSHVGHPILGMNTVQLYMKVPGCRTPGHQENNNFCSVNINIGPGDCEWFGVPEEYWGPMASLCSLNNTNFVHGSWWPNLDELHSHNIPVYRFIQKPGDLVWVNTGTVHWVQAIGWCNNIAWNVGPITTKQFRSALERYEWNKDERYKSIVPMIHLTWNLAKNVEIHDEELFDLIKKFLKITLLHCEGIIRELEKKKVEIKWHGKAPHEAAHYCATCEIEVFSILFVKAIEKKLVVHCAKCALEASQVLEHFVVLQEFDINYLQEIYSSFTFRNRRINGRNLHLALF